MLGFARQCGPIATPSALRCGGQLTIALAWDTGRAVAIGEHGAMCGIVGYTGARPVAPILFDGLAKLEYRGYDSAGIAVVEPSGRIARRRSKGKLSELVAATSGRMPDGQMGIGHTRWATHGGPTDDNAHPHTDCGGDVAVVHNGIVENFVELREELESQGHVFSSETDSECIPHLIESYMAEGLSLEDATIGAAGRIRGAQAVVAISRGEPDKLTAFRQGNAGGIVVGYGDGEMLVASDLPALLPHTRTVAYLAGGEAVTVTPTEARYSALSGGDIVKNPSTVPYDPLAAVKGQYKHYMLKEIHEQPEAALNVMRGRVSFDTCSVSLDGFPLTADEVMRLKRVILIGMGTSMHAAMVGRHWIETLARIQTDYDNSSEFRYRDPVIGEDTLVVSVSQSGETGDTLAAMGEAALKGARQVTLCNYEGTQATRIADGTIFIRSGLEVSVAGSKTFTCSLLSLYMLALHLGATREALGHDDLQRLVGEMAQLPHLIGTQLEDESTYQSLARKYALHSDFLYLGRGNLYPLAMEGALKLKELSYIHAEGYPAGEMKHGPISLIDENMPVVALIPQGPLYEKMLNSVSEANARGARVIAIATEGDSLIAEHAEDVVYVPKISETLAPLLMAAPLQLLAYHIAARRGVDVDQPRNLAKTVTVE